MRSSKSASNGIAAVVALLLAACGTTASVPEGFDPARGGARTAAADAGAQPRTDVRVDGGASDPTAATSVPGRGPRGTSPVSSRQGGTTAAGDGPSGSTDGPAVRGITDTTITVGITWLDLNALIAIYAPTADNDTGQATTKDAAEAVVAWMNERGGIAGRQIEAIYHEYPIAAAADASSRGQEEQAMCDKYTKDNAAFAAVPLVADTGVFYSCAAERDLVSFAIGNTDQVVDEQRFAEIGSIWYRPSWINAERREHVMVEQLVRRGFLEPGVKLGVMVYDDPITRRVYERTLVPALAEIGIEPASVAYYGMFDQMNSSVLQFRSDGVDHIMWSVCPCGGLTQSNFMTAAESQGYQPTYAISTDLWIGALRATGAPPEQLDNTVGIGWNSQYDVGAVVTGTGGERDCVAAAEAGGLPTAVTALSYCEALFLLKRGLEQAPSLSADGFRAGVEQLSSTYDPVVTFSTTFGANRHDGAAAIRDVYFRRDCDCWVYDGPVVPVG